MKVLAIAQRELTSMLGGIVGWLVITSFAVISGIVWLFAMMGYSESSKQLVAAPYMDFQLTFADHLLWPFFYFQAMFLLFLVPAVTMRLFSEELRQHTLELLMTSPISTAEIVFGKFLGAMGLVTLMLLSTGFIPIFMLAWTDVDWVLLLTGYLAVWLATSNIAAIGMLCSSFTKHQVLALVLTEGIAFALLLAAGSTFDPSGLLKELAWTAHMENLAHGLLSLYDLSFFAAGIAIPLLATHQRLEARRW